MAQDIEYKNGVVTREGVEGQCRCGKPAETEIQIGWFAELKGPGRGQYEQVCWGCRDESEKPSEPANYSNS